MQRNTTYGQTFLHENRWLLREIFNIYVRQVLSGGSPGPWQDRHSDTVTTDYKYTGPETYMSRNSKCKHASHATRFGARIPVRRGKWEGGGMAILFRSVSRVSCEAEPRQAGTNRLLRGAVDTAIHILRNFFVDVWWGRRALRCFSRSLGKR